MILELDTSLLNKFDISINQLVFISLVLNENQTNNQDNKIYSASEQLLLSIKRDQESMFDQFYEVFPVYVTRPDGTKGYLRANVNKCRKEYNRIIGKSKAMHDHIMACLRYEIDDKMRTGKMGYMKTMWKWLTQHEWECYEEQMNDNPINEDLPYGSGVI